MAAQVLQDLANQVTVMVDTATAAKTVIDAFPQRLQDAVTAAMANGATAAELAPIQAEIDAMKAASDALAASIAANSSAGPVVTTPPVVPSP